MSRQCWSSAQLARFLVVARGSRLEAAWHLSALGGLRSCELLALRWSDVDLDAGYITIRRACIGVLYAAIAAPPGYNRTRTSPLNGDQMATLYAHRERQQVERSEWGASYGPHDLVVCQQNGRPLHPRALSRAFAALVDEAGLPQIEISALRLVRRAYSRAEGVVA